MEVEVIAEGVLQVSLNDPATTPETHPLRKLDLEIRLIIWALVLSRVWNGMTRPPLLAALLSRQFLDLYDEALIVFYQTNRYVANQLSRVSFRRMNPSLATHLRHIEISLDVLFNDFYAPIEILITLGNQFQTSYMYPFRLHSLGLRIIESTTPVQDIIFDQYYGSRDHASWIINLLLDAILVLRHHSVAFRFLVLMVNGTPIPDLTPFFPNSRRYDHVGNLIDLISSHHCINLFPKLLGVTSSRQQTFIWDVRYMVKDEELMSEEELEIHQYLEDRARVLEDYDGYVKAGRIKWKEELPRVEELDEVEGEEGEDGNGKEQGK